MIAIYRQDLVISSGWRGQSKHDEADGTASSDESSINGIDGTVNKQCIRVLFVSAGESR